MKIALFLGSGISFPTGLPNMEVITHSILWEEWHHHSDQSFVYGQHPRREDNWAYRVQKFLRLLDGYAGIYFATKREHITTYEDLSYILSQLSDEIHRDMENPAILPFMKDIKEMVDPICTPISNVYKEVNLKSLVDKSINFIGSALSHHLYTKKDPIRLGLISDLAKSDKIERLDIFTLNHDLLIEKQLRSNKIESVDGFGEPDGDLRFFDPYTEYEKDVKVRLLKLHGSINWWRMRPSSILNRGYDVYCSCERLSVLGASDSNGNNFQTLEPTPITLVGTANKVSKYYYGIFNDIHLHFRKILWEHDKIIISGYGWNDKGTNVRLFEWLDAKRENQIYLLHREPEKKIRDESFSAMRHRYDKLVDSKKIIPIKKWMEDVNLDEIMRLIEKQ